MTRMLAIGLLSLFAYSSGDAQPPLSSAAKDAQSRVVKVYGAGGVSGLESYQSGFFVSPEGHIATAWSYVLDVEPIVVLDDGRRFESKIVGFEPSLELAVLKIEVSGVPYFRVGGEVESKWGDAVLAVSNLFGIAAGNEPASVMQGNIATITALDCASRDIQNTLPRKRSDFGPDRE